MARRARLARRRTARSGALRVALIYAVVAAAWIVISDQFLDRFGTGLVLVSIGKGLLFVVATACMLFVLVRRHSSALERAEQQMRATVESMTDPVLVADRAGRIAQANQAALNLFAPDVIGRPTAGLFGGHEDVLAVALRGAPVPASEVCVDSTSGLKRTFSVRASPIWEETEIVGAVASLRDVSELRESEQRHRVLSAELAKSNKRKDEFIAMLSHELRNPLAPIRNSLYVLNRADPMGDQAARAKAVIERQVVHMSRLVDELLDATRISRGLIELKRERLELNALVWRVAEDHRSVFASRGVGFAVELLHRRLYVNGDPVRLAQVVGNLLLNAAKFTPAGGSARLSVTQAGPGHAAVRVEDTGMGVPAELLPQLFAPFVQADKSLARSQGGLGLGLVLVKGIVELHGGDVSAASDGRGRGATFMVRLPVESAAPLELVQPEAVNPPGHATRVLIIEDNVDAGESLKEALEMNGHVVAVATSGQEGIEKAHALGPDVILCDIGLPGMDGYEVARRLRADPELATIRLIALSGYAQPEDITRSRAAGFEDHVAKPPLLDQLEEKLAPALPRRVQPARR